MALFQSNDDYEEACFINRFCTSLDWDKDGDILTVAHDKNGKHGHLLINNWRSDYDYYIAGILFFWSPHNFDVVKFDTGMK